jgi:hypothetical protein
VAFSVKKNTGGIRIGMLPSSLFHAAVFSPPLFRVGLGLMTIGFALQLVCS